MDLKSRLKKGAAFSLVLSLSFCALKLVVLSALGLMFVLLYISVLQANSPAHMGNLNIAPTSHLCPTE